MCINAKCSCHKFTLKYQKKQEAPALAEGKVNRQSTVNYSVENYSHKKINEYSNQFVHILYQFSLVFSLT